MYYFVQLCKGPSFVTKNNSNENFQHFGRCVEGAFGTIWSVGKLLKKNDGWKKTIFR